MPFVYSTMTADQAYSNWIVGGGDMKRHERICVIKGGSNVANKNLITPHGVVTQVTDKQLELLEQCDAFKRHKERGFIRVEKQEASPEKVASDMEGKDESAPLTEGDFAEGKVSAGKKKGK